jgi:hypothetical protein
MVIFFPRTECVSTEHEYRGTSSTSTGAGAAFRAIATDLGAGEPQLVAERHRKRFLLHDVDAPLLSVDDQCDQALDTAWLAG